MNISGPWTLKSFMITPPDGNQRHWGNGIRGLLIYDPTGHMSVSINKVIQSTGSPDKDTLDAMLFYAGTYRIEGNTIRHDVTIASNPNRVGREMIRFAQVDGNRLILTTPPESYGIATLVWEKIS